MESVRCQGDESKRKHLKPQRNEGRQKYINAKAENEPKLHMLSPPN